MWLRRLVGSVPEVGVGDGQLLTKLSELAGQLLVAGVGGLQPSQQQGL